LVNIEISQKPIRRGQQKIRTVKRSVSHERPATRTRRVLLVAAPGSQILDVVGPFQIFTRAAELLLTQQPGSTAAYSVEIITSSPKPVLVTNCGLRVSAHRTFRRVRGEIDTLLIAGGSAVEDDETGIDVVRWLRGVAGQVRRIGSVCTGAMLLARAGLLNGRKATTHWKWCGSLARKYPSIDVDPDPIFIRDGKVYTSAGVTAGMDLALALVEEDHGSRLALEVARDLVLYLRRPGGQSQFSVALSTQLSDRKPLRDLAAWMLNNLSSPLNVQVLAKHVAMSPRNFARIFTREMRTTPAKYVEHLRVEMARRRLEETQHTLKRITGECGFGNTKSMRGAFQRALRITPGEYRQRFQGASRPAGRSGGRSRGIAQRH
jgi:transcriptional regulator GlxA family with amidase domain